ncbi:MULTISPECIES: dihydrofolate reductase family protein [unclassified Nocardioides]|uniref:dihydrofolate reductase family protein n=1 Tax=unclassified Nocardioides TaxID=2615069 RepID=UPI00361EFD0B
MRGPSVGACRRSSTSPPAPSTDSSRTSTTPSTGSSRLRAATVEGGIWVVGGGDLVGQFDDAGLLDEIVLGMCPVTLGAGAPLLPRRITSGRLRVAAVTQDGARVRIRLAVDRRQPARG